MNAELIETASTQDVLLGILLGIVWSLLALGGVSIAYKILERVCK